MSLEATIQENTAALRELIALLAAGAAIDTAKATKVMEKPVTAVAEVQKEQAKAEEKKPAAIPAADETSAATAEAVVESPSEVTYDDVKDAIKEMAKKSREMAIGALKEFGAAKGPDLKAEQYAAFVAHAKKLMGAA